MVCKKKKTNTVETRLQSYKKNDTRLSGVKGIVRDKTIFNFILKKSIKMKDNNRP